MEIIAGGGHYDSRRGQHLGGAGVSDWWESGSTGRGRLPVPNWQGDERNKEEEWSSNRKEST